MVQRDKSIAPAFRIPLADTELKMLGELCAIQGQVEHLLVYTLHYVLDVQVETARAILATNSIHTNAKTWIKIFQEKCSDKRVLELADFAFGLVEGITQGRNDFVHALYARPMGTMWLLDHVPKGTSHKRGQRNEAIAIRTRDTKKKRPISDLIDVRNDAARLSVLLSDIANEFLPDQRD
jgi:hypothetical protein